MDEATTAHRRMHTYTRTGMWWCVVAMELGLARQQVHLPCHAPVGVQYNDFVEEGRQAAHATADGASPASRWARRCLTDTRPAGGPANPAAASPGHVAVDMAGPPAPAGSSAAGPGRGAAGADPPKVPFSARLQALVAAPLVGVQVSLVKDAAFWKSGLLATPPVSSGKGGGGGRAGPSGALHACMHGCVQLCMM